MVLARWTGSPEEMGWMAETARLMPLWQSVVGGEFACAPPSAATGDAFGCEPLAGPRGSLVPGPG